MSRNFASPTIVLREREKERESFEVSLRKSFEVSSETETVSFEKDRVFK